jgi:hypothetical protein
MKNELKNVIAELKKELKNTASALVKKALETELKNTENALFELTKHEKTAEVFNKLKSSSQSQNFSSRDGVALAYIIAKGGELTNAEQFTSATVQEIFKACGLAVSGTDGQYRQGIPQLISTATALKVKLTLKAEFTEPAESENK